MTEWSAYDPSGYLAVASTAATLLSGLAFEDPGTIIRTRGQIVIRPVANFAADVDIVGAFGIGLVSAEAFAAVSRRFLSRIRIRTGGAGW